ncbi:MAG: aspartyl-tRNA(Asn)/glutamyl-tRNA (Gln) amidotransferase subunit C [Microgenomates group bacterium Gr01-1014_7]|nr:MAG: aspartyl-tRNA(Asn)/glutamyl-tRNA (Gln) amidotransferase subunit C [Microgenomates group bacterium Gr01-1014_7]
MKIDVKKIAKLANLPITDYEEEKLAEQLSQTLDYVNKLEEIDTKGVEPTSQVTGLENVTRDDEITNSLSQEEALKNAKSKRDGFFVVKAIFDNE